MAYSLNCLSGRWNAFFGAAGVHTPMRSWLTMAVPVERYPAGDQPPYELRGSLGLTVRPDGTRLLEWCPYTPVRAGGVRHNSCGHASQHPAQEGREEPCAMQRIPPSRKVRERIAPCWRASRTRRPAGAAGPKASAGTPCLSCRTAHCPSTCGMSRMREAFAARPEFDGAIDGHVFATPEKAAGLVGNPILRR